MTLTNSALRYIENPADLIMLALGNAYEFVLANAINYFPHELTTESPSEQLVEKILFLVKNDEWGTLDNIFSAPITWDYLSQADRNAVFQIHFKTENATRNADQEDGQGVNWNEVIQSAIDAFGNIFGGAGQGQNPPPPPPPPQNTGSVLTPEVLRLLKIGGSIFLGIAAFAVLAWGIGQIRKD